MGADEKENGMFVEETEIGGKTIRGEIVLDRYKPEMQSEISRIKKMLYNRLAHYVLEYDLTRNEAVSYLLYEDGYSNSEVVALMTELFNKSFWKQNINDYRKKALCKIEAGRQISD